LSENSEWAFLVVVAPALLIIPERNLLFIFQFHLNSRNRQYTDADPFTAMESLPVLLVCRAADDFVDFSRRAAAAARVISPFAKESGSDFVLYLGAKAKDAE
jgi:hypothetical protein